MLSLIHISDSIGNLEWMNSFGGIRFEAGYSSVETTDGGYLTAGWTRSFGFGNNSNRDVILVKWDSLGNYLWYQTYGSSDYEMAIGITPVSYTHLNIVRRLYKLLSLSKVRLEP